MSFNPVYYTYIVECNDKSFYTGITDNLEIRIKEHNGFGSKPGAKYTRSKRPVKLVHFEEFATRKEAAAREREIKKMDRAEKEVVVANGDRPSDV